MAGFSLGGGRVNYTISTATSGTIPGLLSTNSLTDIAGFTYGITNTSGATITLTATSFPNSAGWGFATPTSIDIDPDATVFIETEVAGSDYAILASSSAGGAGATIATDTTSSSPVFPAFLHTTSGALTTVYNNGATLNYTPSTGAFASASFDALGGVFFNPRVLTASTTIPGGNNGFSVGPVTIPAGVTLVVSANSLVKYI